MTPLQPPPIHKPNGLIVRFAKNPAAAIHAALHVVLAHLDHVRAALGHALVPVVIVTGAALVLGTVAFVSHHVAWRRGGHLVEIAPPSVPDPRGGLACWRMLAPLLSSRAAFVMCRPPVVFDCLADEGGLSIGLWVAKTLSPESIAGAVEAAWPGARTRVTAARELPPGRVAAGRAHLGAPEWFALGGTDPVDGDPLRAVFSALSNAGSSGAGVYAVAVRPASGRRITRARRAALALRRGEPSGSTSRLGGFVSFVAGTPSGPSTRASTSDPLALLDVRDVTGKMNDAPHFEVALRYGVVTSDDAGTGRGARRVRRRWLRELAGAFGLFTARNRLVGRFVLVRPRARLVSRRLGRGFLCSAPELAALAHLPSEPPAYGMAAPPALRVRAPREVANRV